MFTYKNITNNNNTKIIILKKNLNIPNKNMQEYYKIN